MESINSQFCLVLRDVALPISINRAISLSLALFIRAK